MKLLSKKVSRTNKDQDGDHCDEKSDKKSTKSIQAGTGRVPQTKTKQNQGQHNNDDTDTSETIVPKQKAMQQEKQHEISGDRMRQRLHLELLKPARDMSSSTTTSKTSSLERKIKPKQELLLPNKEDDPYDFVERFVHNQARTFSTALGEIQEGRKQGCWLWWIFPTAPYIVNGVERGSSMNSHFALRGDDCVKAYLKFQYKAINLRKNYVIIAKAVESQLNNGNSLRRLFGPMDDAKVRSSLTLFQRIANETDDKEVANVCQSVLEMTEVESRRKPDKRRGPLMFGIV